ncbi:hypothetical protein [Sphingopyxis sp.]|uniref:hypothetical protein n=1 Tax=Sphingopyxis sp. TaxID=1908224 RepID=UPI002FC8390B
MGNPAPKIDDDLRLSPSDGRFSAPLDLHELPIDADKGFSERLKIFLGIGPDEKVLFCRPIGSDTNPSVDNAICD